MKIRLSGSPSESCLKTARISAKSVAGLKEEGLNTVIILNLMKN